MTTLFTTYKIENSWWRLSCNFKNSRGSAISLNYRNFVNSRNPKGKQANYMQKHNITYLVYCNYFITYTKYLYNLKLHQNTREWKYHDKFHIGDSLSLQGPLPTLSNHPICKSDIDIPFISCYKVFSPYSYLLLYHHQLCSFISFAQPKVWYPGSFNYYGRYRVAWTTGQETVVSLIRLRLKRFKEPSNTIFTLNNTNFSHYVLNKYFL